MSFQGPGSVPGQPPQGQPDPYSSPQPDEYTSYQQPQAYEQYQSYDQPQGYDQPQAYDQYGQQYAQDGYAQSSAPPAPQQPQYAPQPAQSAPPYGQPWAAPQTSSGLSSGAIVALVGGGLVVLLVLVLGGVWLATRDGGTPSTGPSTAPPSAAPEDAGDGKGIPMSDSSTAEDLFPATLEPPKHPKYDRTTVGETDCANVAAGDQAKNTLSEIGCKKAYLALYVSDDKKYAVTMGYLDVGSESAAKDNSDAKFGDYPDYNSWLKYLIPDGSKITEQTKIYTYVASHEQYVTYGVGAYYDGKDAEEGLDDTLMREAIGVAVAIQFA